MWPIKEKKSLILVQASKKGVKRKRERNLYEPAVALRRSDAFFKTDTVLVFSYSLLALIVNKHALQKHLRSLVLSLLKETDGVKGCPEVGSIRRFEGFAVVLQVNAGYFYLLGLTDQRFVFG